MLTVREYVDSVRREMIIKSITQAELSRGTGLDVPAIKRAFNYSSKMKNLSLIVNYIHSRPRKIKEKILVNR